MSKQEYSIGILLRAIQAAADAHLEEPMVYNHETFDFRPFTPHEKATVARYLARQAKRDAYRIQCNRELDRAERRERRAEAREHLKAASAGIEAVHKASLKVVSS